MNRKWVFHLTSHENNVVREICQSRKLPTFIGQLNLELRPFGGVISMCIASGTFGKGAFWRPCFMGIVLLLLTPGLSHTTGGDEMNFTGSHEV